MIAELRNAHGERLDFSLHEAPQPTEKIAVLGHGVTGNKDRPFLVALAEGLASAGLSALRFSFSGNGASEGAFQESTLSKEVADLGAVLAALTGRAITYIGHSMGAAVGVLRASRDPRIQRLVSLAGMVQTKEFAEREFGTVTPGQGYMWDEPACPLSQAYMDDMRRVGSVQTLAPRIHVPWLFVHGTADDVVPLQDSLDIFAAANCPKDLVQIPDANHVFSGEHTEVMVKHIVAWLTHSPEQPSPDETSRHAADSLKERW